MCQQTCSVRGVYDANACNTESAPRPLRVVAQPVTIYTEGLLRYRFADVGRGGLYQPFGVEERGVGLRPNSLSCELRASNRGAATFRWIRSCKGVHQWGGPQGEDG